MCPKIDLLTIHVTILYLQNSIRHIMCPKAICDPHAYQRTFFCQFLSFQKTHTHTHTTTHKTKIKHTNTIFMDHLQEYTQHSQHSFKIPICVLASNHIYAYLRTIQHLRTIYE